MEQNEFFPALNALDVPIHELIAMLPHDIGALVQKMEFITIGQLAKTDHDEVVQRLMALKEHNSLKALKVENEIKVVRSALSKLDIDHDAVFKEMEHSLKGIMARYDRLESKWTLSQIASIHRIVGALNTKCIESTAMRLELDR